MGGINFPTEYTSPQAYSASEASMGVTQPQAPFPERNPLPQKFVLAFNSPYAAQLYQQLPNPESLPTINFADLIKNDAIKIPDKIAKQYGQKNMVLIVIRADTEQGKLVFIPATDKGPDAQRRYTRLGPSFDRDMIEFFNECEEYIVTRRVEKKEPDKVLYQEYRLVRS